MSNGFILVVDDNPTNLAVISQALRTEGWQIRIAVDGEDALSKVAHNPPELILLDVQMPGIDGFEVCKRLKADEATSDIPIIFMTALSDTDSKVKGLGLGAVDYITKPFEQQEAIARVRVHLQLRHLTHTLEEQVRDRTQALSQALE
jgi:DNA-binding response OmpR family regulator